MQKLWFLTGILLIAGCSWQTPPERSTPTRVSESVAEQRGAVSAPRGAVPRRTPEQAPALIAATIAQQQVGTPYRYGGMSTSGFDCSGLVHYAYLEAGHSVPRTTAGLWQGSSPVSDDRLRPGDVLFFRFDGKPSHVGLYLGDDWFVHAPSTGKRVSTERLSNPFYQQRFIRAGRLVD
ncbi:MAG: C40 family peptidase [Pseudomonadota bacterium]